MPTVSLHFDSSLVARLAAAGPDETVHITLSIDVAPDNAHDGGVCGEGRSIAPQGPLAELMLKGLLKAGDTLSFQQPRAGREAVATVTADGRLIVEGKAVPFTSPSKAASAVTGTASNGWALWRTAAGQTLDALRTQLHQL
ncbi:site-specific DNA-methyltransferase (adenine-specific) [Streptomyces sp. V4I8]